jgi:hypothetical protein
VNRRRLMCIMEVSPWHRTLSRFGVAADQGQSLCRAITGSAG